MNGFSHLGYRFPDGGSLKRLVHSCSYVIRWGSTPGDATVASQLRVRNAYPQEWACIRNRACLLTGYEASPHPTSKHATSAASIPVRSLSSTVGTVGILARAFRPIIACAPTLWKSGIDAAYLADPQV